MRAMTTQQRVYTLRLLAMALVLLAVGVPGAARAESTDAAGEVVFVRGLMSVQHADGSIAVVGTGDRLLNGDTIITGENGHGIIQLADGSRITLRPGTRFALEEIDTAPEEPFIGVRLLRGGIRALTGWISKQRKGKGFELSTQTAVCGVRGTEFDARLCEGDCSKGAAEGKSAERPVSAAVGRVVQLRGELAALEPGGRIRGLTTGAAVLQGDRLETGADSFALVAFRDGSRVTLQADSVFSVDDYQYQKDDPASTPSAFFRLLRGGVRMLTGIIAKQQPERVQVATPTAVCGVRGTGFDLALCQAPCEKPAAPEAAVAARVLQVDGPLSAQQPGQSRRELKQGDDIFSGDILQTGPQTVAVAVFRDDSRVALQPATRFEVSRYLYAGKAEDGGGFRLWWGGVRMLAGWLAKRGSTFTVHTATAVIGVRGTGFDLLCTGRCAAGAEGPPEGSWSTLEDLGLVARVWDGTIVMANDSGQSLVGTGMIVQVASVAQPPVTLPQAPPIMDKLPAPRPDQLTVDLKRLFAARHPRSEKPSLILNTWDGEVILNTEGGRTVSVMPGQTILYAGGTAMPVQLPAMPGFILQDPAPRPDQVPVNMEQLFDSTDRTGAEPGFYVSVQDGDVVLSNKFGEIYLGKGESGFAAFGAGGPIRLAAAPLFLVLDPYPRPATGGNDRPDTVELFREDFGGPDSRKETECEIR